MVNPDIQLTKKGSYLTDMATPHKKSELGDLLVESGEISAKQLQIALKEQKRSGRKLGATLIDLGYTSEERLLDVLSRQLKIPLIDLARYKYDTEILRRLPETQARRYRTPRCCRSIPRIFISNRTRPCCVSDGVSMACCTSR